MVTSGGVIRYVEVVKMEEKKYTFLVSWFDNAAQITREFYLIYFWKDGSLELYDRKSRKCFLKRTPCNSVREQDLYVGSIINVFSRKMLIAKHFHEESSSRLERNTERIIIILKDAKETLGTILQEISTQNLQLVKLRELILSHQCIAVLHAYHGKQWKQLNELTGEHVLFMEILGADCLIKANQILNETDKQSKEKKIVYHSSSISHMAEEDSQIFLEYPVDMETTENTTCCIIKPHAIKEGLAGKIICDISSSFTIERIQMVDLDNAQSERFLEVYKGVIPEYQALVTQMVSGPLIVMAVVYPSSPPESVVKFRSFVGPADPVNKIDLIYEVIARRLRPQTLRAKYGKGHTENAVHCTDLPEDGQREVDFFFTQCIADYS